MPKLLDQYGNPIDTALLKTEMATPTLTGVRSVLSAHPTVGLTPQRLALLLRGAEGGNPAAYLELAEEMEEKYLHYLSVLNTRKRAVLGLEITVEAADDSAAAQAQADLVREAVPVIESALFDIMDAVGKGFSQCEILWDTSEKQWMPRELAWRDPRWFVFSRLDGRTPRIRDGFSHPVPGEELFGDGIPIPPYKFVSHVVSAKSGLPIRGGLARAAAWSFLFQNFAIKDWVVFAEVYGHPIRIGRYQDGVTDPAQIQILLDALRAIGSDAAAAIPRSMEIALESAGGKADAGIWERLARFMDENVSKGVLGQTLTTQTSSSGGGAFALGKVHNEVRYDILHSDCRQLSSTLNRDLVRAIVDLNFGEQRAYPTLTVRFEEPEDLAALAGNLKTLVPLKTPVPVSWVLEKFGIPAAQEGEPLLGMAAASPEPASNRAAHAAQGSADAIDTMTDAMMGDWREMVGPMANPIQAAIDEAHRNGETAEQFLTRLPALLQDMPVDLLTERLARAAFAARLAGEAGFDIE